MKVADLHVHSHFSDGTLAPSAIVAEAVRKGFSCISITDHDTIDALDAAINVADENLEIIPGIELTAESQGQEIHILGYLIDYRNDSFLKMLAMMQDVRIKRVSGICEKLKKLKCFIEPEDVFKFAAHGSVGRLHVARALLQKGYVGSTSEAFVRFIGEKGAAYVGKFKMSPQEVIGWILKVKGIPVLAHPHLLGDKTLISDLVKAGIMGLEAFYPEHSEYQTQEFLKIAQKHGLLVTGGSDCHGYAKEEIKLGLIKLPYEYVEKLKEAQCKLR